MITVFIEINNKLEDRKQEKKSGIVNLKKKQIQLLEIKNRVTELKLNDIICSRLDTSGKLLNWNIDQTALSRMQVKDNKMENIDDRVRDMEDRVRKP